MCLLIAIREIENFCSFCWRIVYGGIWVSDADISGIVTDTTVFNLIIDWIISALKQEW